jgi:hypothetical protein
MSHPFYPFRIVPVIPSAGDPVVDIEYMDTELRATCARVSARNRPYYAKAKSVQDSDPPASQLSLGNESGRVLT